jgi:2-keto-4-pentenoate hydratase/2-oxohepta-3-ene-1,7-dioic acid hydratase in catechol pathway/imidazolonepropionase-like amidohydrolase/pimeloyl-ACP methyl ester carboxylesterase
MSGLGDAHVHFSWNNGDLDKLGELGVEEHTLLTARSAQCYIDSGYTMCYGAASAKERLDIVIRDAINEGSIPGPRYLANGKEMAVPDGELVAGITAFAKGPLEMREVIRHHIKLGVDNIKLSMSGEQILETRDAQDCYYTDEETAACVDEAHRHGVRLCAHARARDSVKMCVKHGVDIIYHGSWIDEEGMDMLEKAKSKHIVAPGLNWLIATVYEASAFGYSFEKAEQVGYKKELEVAIEGLKEMKRRGITILPGGDYGFAWTPHGTYARDLEHFVKLLEYTPMESIVAATAGVAKLFMREDELGKVLPGFFADCILVNGNPLEDITVLQDHSKLDVIMINGRFHKASRNEFLSPTTRQLSPEPVKRPKFHNFVAYELADGTKRTRVGHLDVEDATITPLAFAGGTLIENLYQIVEVGENTLTAGGEAFPLDDNVNILPPISGRDVLAVGKNYADHAKEFNASGYDSSDKTDMPSHPVIFTKRSTSIIANEEDIILDENFTQTLDYEGEIGVIIGKGGSHINEDSAANHIWGYTIINDVTAREKQRDHKQFYIGKSADSYCPIGPLAVSKSALNTENMSLKTHVNGQLRQEASIGDLIFSIPKLIATLSDSHTLRPGDVIATGTPAGVGFGHKPPVFLQVGDVVEVSVSGIGILRNKVVSATGDTYSRNVLEKESHIPINNLAITNGGLGLTTLQCGKQLYAKKLGSGSQTIIFVHGLGGSTSFYTPMINKLGLDKEDSPFTTMLFDLEGHGMSPTKATSKVDIESYAQDISGLIEALKLPTSNGITLVAHSMGCLAASLFASKNSSLVNRLVLIGPPPCPLPAAGADGSIKRASLVREEGMHNVAIVVATAGTSAKTRADRPLAFTAVQMSLLTQDPEGYAKGCTAIASAKDLSIEFGGLGENVETLIITGEEDKISPPAHVSKLAKTMGASSVVLPEVGHWHVFEDPEGVTKAAEDFLHSKSSRVKAKLHGITNDRYV